MPTTIKSPEVHTAELENGLGVTAIALPHLHTATIALFVKVGSRFESPEDNGLSHFVEHMLFRGTKSYPSSRALGLAIESLGSSLEAETGRDLSVYHMSIEPDLVDQGLSLMSEFASRPRFADIELERSIILEEMAADYGEDGQEINGHDIARGLVFGSHPLGQRIIGPIANVRRFDAGDVTRLFQAHYTARNIHLIAAGPVAVDAVLTRVRAEFSHIPPGLAAMSETPGFAQDRAHYARVADTVSQTSIHVLYRSIPDIHPDYTASVALCRALDEGMAAPLHYELCDQRGLAYEIGAYIEPLADVALFEISATTSQAKVPELTRGILSLCARFREQLMSADELSRIKRRYRYDLASILDDSYAMASMLGMSVLYYRPPGIDERLARMEALSTERIRDAANLVFRPERLSVAIVGPLSRARQSEVRQLVAEWA